MEDNERVDLFTSKAPDAGTVNMDIGAKVKATHERLLVEDI